MYLSKMKVAIEVQKVDICKSDDAGGHKMMMLLESIHLAEKNQTDGVGVETMWSVTKTKLN